MFEQKFAISIMLVFRCCNWTSVFNVRVFNENSLKSTSGLVSAVFFFVIIDVFRLNSFYRIQFFA